MKFISLNIKTSFIYAVLALLIITVVTTLIFENQSGLIVQNAVMESRDVVESIITDAKAGSIAGLADREAAGAIAKLVHKRGLDSFIVYGGSGKVLATPVGGGGREFADARDFSGVNRAIFNMQSEGRPFYADNDASLQKLKKSAIDFYIPFSLQSGNDIVLKVALRQESIDVRMGHLYRQVAIVIAGMVLAILFIAMVFRRVVISPVLEISRVSGLVGSGNLSERIVHRSNDEVGLLAARFNDMIDSLEEKKRLLRQNMSELEKRDQMVTQELAIANSIQRSMLPVDSDRSGLRIVSHYAPLHRISGDFYDTVEFPDGATGVIIIDVSGHGIPAALITIMIKFLVSSYGEYYRSPAEALTVMNSEIAKVLRTGDYIAAYYLIIEPDNNVRFSGAGNPPALVLEQDGGTLYELADDGLFLGLTANPPLGYEAKTWRIREGDRIILYTDGITEQRNAQGEMYGEARLYSVIMDNYRDDSSALLAKITDDISRFSEGAPQNDDMTLLIVEPGR